MFTIIGGDNKPYGPVSEAEVREWLAQGRADGRTLASKEGGEWKPLATFLEFADVTGGVGTSATPPPFSQRTSGAPTTEELLARDFEINISSLLSRSWTLLLQNFWPVVGITFLVVISLGLINHFINMISEPAMKQMLSDKQFSPQAIGLVCLTTLLTAPVQAIFSGGLYYYYLKLIRGEEATLGDAFAGFSRSVSSLAMVGLMVMILTIVGVCLCILPGMYVSVCWIFAVPLIMDKQLDFWTAMTLSLKVVSKHWFMVFALLIVVALVSCAGILALCLGFFVSLPLGYLMMMYAYEDIFGSRAG